MSFWFSPAVLGVIALLLAQALVSLDRYLLDTRVDTTGSLLYHVGASGSRDILGAIGGSMLGVAATSFSITISVLATASSSYGPRLVRNFMADRGNQVVLGIFGATFLYSLMVLRSIRSIKSDGSVFVPDIAVNVAVALAVVDVGVLVYFIHHIAQSIQVATLSARVRDELSESVDALYPPENDVERGRSAEDIVKPPVYITVLAEESGVIIDIDEGRVLDIATDSGTLVEIHRTPGDHVVAGEPLADILAERSADIAESSIERVRGTFDIGTSRTPRHDIAFAVEQMTEMAVRALLTGVNDPYRSQRNRRPLGGTRRRRSAPSTPTDALRLRLHGACDRSPRGRFVADRPCSRCGGIYGTGSPMVVLAGIRLAERVGRAARATGDVDAVLAQLDLLDRALAGGENDSARTADAREQISRTRTAITDRVPLAVLRSAVR